MKALKRISLVLIALLALGIISTAEKTAEKMPDYLRGHPWVISYSLFCMLLIASFIYLHWLFLQFALPLNNVSASVRKDILSRSKMYYARGRILIGIGYFVLFMFICSFFMAQIYPEVRQPPQNTLIPAIIFFIVFGIFIRIRSVVIYLAQHLTNLT